MSQKIALLIGVSQYKDLPLLDAALHDIEAVRDVLENPHLGQFDDVLVLPNPKSTQMQREIQTLFARCKKDDLVLLYFSGHGMTDDDTKLYLTTATTEKDLFQATCVPASFVHDVMNRSRCKRQVVILDCCYSGAFAEGWQPRGDGVLDLKQQLGGEGRAVLTSSSAVQLSFEQEGSGIYTRYLVEGLKTGAADRNGNGRISIQELHEYAKEKVQTAKPGMKPEIYTYKEGFEIVLTQTPVVAKNPELEYRRQVEKFVKGRWGEISGIARRVLKKQAVQLRLSVEVATQIEAEVLAPYEERQRNLAEYREAFSEAVAEEYPLSDAGRYELQCWGEMLGLTAEDVAEIEGEVLQQFNLEVVSDSPTFASSRGEPEPQTENQSKTPVSEKPEEIVLQTFRFEVVTVNRQGKEIQRRPGESLFFPEDLGDGNALEMVQIPGGSFEMGTDDDEIERLCKLYGQDYFRWEGPQHRVTIQPFLMGKYSVTQEQWEAVAALPKVERDLEPSPSHFKGKNRPVECISWYDSEEFCKRLSRKMGREYRLPSEAEWEYACRAGTSTPFHFGETIATELANYDGNYTYADAPKGEYRQETTEVGGFLPNAFGLYDMHGNVWEWCADGWHDSYKNAPSDESIWLSSDEDNGRMKLLRGGSWNSYPRFCRCADRYRDFVDDGYHYIGFRVACRLAARTL